MVLQRPHFVGSYERGAGGRVMGMVAGRRAVSANSALYAVLLC